MNGNGLRGGDWIDTGVTFDLDEAGRPLHWMRLTFRQEFQRDEVEDSQNRWDLWVDEKLVSVDMGYYDNENVDPGRITLLGHRRIPLLMDELTVSTGNPLFADTNVNGLADAYEDAYGLSDGRMGDGDRDGLSNIQELLLQTNPTIADTDQDGLNDGDESGADHRNPLNPDDGTDTANSFGFGILETELGLEVIDARCTEVGVKFGVRVPLADQDSRKFYVAWVSAYDQAGRTLSPYAVYTPVTEMNLYAIGYTGDIISGNIYIYIVVVDETNDGTQENWYYTTLDWNCCTGCSAGFCPSLGSSNLSSIDLTYELGATDFGDDSAAVQLRKKTFTDDVYDRSALAYMGPLDADRVQFEESVNDAGEVINRLQWVRTDRQYTIFEDLPHDQGYQMKMYALENVSENGSVSGEPLRTVTLYNPDPNRHTGVQRLRILEEGGRNIGREYRYRLQAGTGVWELYEGGLSDFLEKPLRYHKLSSQREGANAIGTGKTSKLIVRKRRETGRWDPLTQKLVIDTVTDTRHQRFSHGWQKIEEIRDPEGQALSTRYGYNENAKLLNPQEHPHTIGETARQWIERPDGDWEWYGYDDQGRLNKIVRPIGNTFRPDALPNDGPGYRVEHRAFDGPDYRLRTIETRDGHHVRTQFRQWNDVQAGQDYIETVSISYRPDAQFNDPDNEVTVNVYDGQTNQIKRTEYPNGTVTTHAYAAAEDERRQTTINYLANGNEESSTLKVTHRSGTLIEDQRQDGETGILTNHSTVAELDHLFRPILTINELTGKARTQNYDCCDLSWETTENGQTKVYDRDPLGRLIGETTGYKDPLDFGNTLVSQTSRREYRVNAHDQRLHTSTLPADGSSPLTQSTDYNLAGQQTAQASPSGVITKFRTIMQEDGGRIELTSLPKSGHDNRHRITQQRYEADGTLRQTLTYASNDPFATKPDPRTQVRNTLYTQGQDSKGRYEERADIANIFDVRRTRTYLDQEGRQKEIIHGYGSRLSASEHFDYNTGGELIRHIDPDGVTTRFAYNEKGDRTTTALDLDIQPNEPADHIDYEVDRISVVDHSVNQRQGQTITRTENRVYTETGPVTTTIQEATLDGTQSKVWQYNQLTTTRTEGSEPGSWTITTTDPSGAYVQQTYQNGQLHQTSRHANDGTLISWIAQSYDAYNRVHQITDSRTGTTTYHYDDQGRRWKVSAPNPKTRSSTNGTLDTVYHFDVLGQVITTVKPSGGLVHQVYNANGTLHQTHGYHTTDVQWGYNGRGERTHMTTWYSHLNKPATTRWHYNVRGQLQFKQDAHGQRVHYTYTPGGKLETRTWARGIVTTYHYDQASNLAHIDYSDRTPDVHFTYTRLGQKQTVQDAGGLLTYTYRPDQPTVLLSETRSGDFQSPPNPDHRSVGFSLRPLYNEPKTLTYTLDPLNRPTGFQIGTPENPAQDYQVTYSYDQANRLDRVSSQGYDFVYQFEPMSTTDRLQSVTADGIKHTQYQYEPGRDTITAVINQAGPNNQLVSHYAYQYNRDGQRTERTTTTLDPETNILRPSDTDTFQYQEDTGGLTKSERNDDPTRTEHYGYDKNGNRTSMGKGNGEFALYDTNALNQYTSIWNQDGIQAVTHDPDGNQLTKGNQEYTWDAENRLIEVRERGTLRARYTYDHQSRRIARWTSDGVEERYLYQGWNLINIYANHAQADETYTWGIDLSGSIHGAGGVGGLLLATGKSIEDSWLYHYDANGNVSEISDSRSDILDQYSYDGFGKQESLPSVGGNRFRFSTKFQDRETEAYYYGYRYYDSGNGRWLSRDPIGEEGGLNLYGFVGNDPVNQWDYLGLLGPEPGGIDGGFAVVGWEKKPHESAPPDNFFRDMAGGGNGGRNNKNLGEGESGEDLFSHLKSLSEISCCIRDYRIASHASGGGVGGSQDGAHGFYPNKNVVSPRFTGRRDPVTGRLETELGPADPDARDLHDLRRLINDNSITFCKGNCRISLHVCAVSRDFATRLAAITDCEVVIATGACDAVDGNAAGRPWRSDPSPFLRITPRRERGIVLPPLVEKIPAVRGQFLFDPNKNFQPLGL